MYNSIQLTKSHLKAINVHILVAKGFQDCSLNGISSNNIEVLIPCEGGYIDINDSKIPVVDIFERTIFGKKVLTAKPRKLVGVSASCNGGTFIHSSDARFKLFSPYPISLHDRVEK